MTPELSNVLSNLTDEQRERFDILVCLLEWTRVELHAMDLVQLAHWVHTGRNIHDLTETLESDDAATWTAEDQPTEWAPAVGE